VAEQRGVDIPALVYEARPVVSNMPLLFLAVTCASRDTLVRHRRESTMWLCTAAGTPRTWWLHPAARSCP